MLDFKKIFLTILFILTICNFCEAQVIIVDSQTINIKTGFNFISFIYKLDISPQQLISQNPTIIEIYSYSSSSGSFLSVGDGTLLSLNVGRGYILKANADFILNTSGTGVSQIGNISLKTGFNLIGFSKTTNVCKFSELINKFSFIQGIYKWSGSSGSFIQVIKNSNGQAELIDGIDPNVTQSQSYFINTTKDASLNYDNQNINFIDSTLPSKNAISLSSNISEDSLDYGIGYDLSKLTIKVNYSDGSSQNVYNDSLKWSLVYGNGSISNNVLTIQSNDYVIIKAEYVEKSLTVSTNIKISIKPRPLYDIAEYFPLRTTDSYLHSNGETTYQSKYIGNTNINGVVANKFSSSNNGFEYYLLNENGLGIYFAAEKDIAANKLVKLTSKYPTINEEFLTNISLSGTNYALKSKFISVENNVRLPAGTFDQVLKFELKFSSSGKETTNEIYFAKNIGIIKTFYSYGNIEDVMISGNNNSQTYSPQKKQWTFIVYSCGDTYYSASDLSILLYNQMLGFQNTRIEDNANVIIQYSPSPAAVDGISARFVLENDKLKIVKIFNDKHINTGDTNEVTDFYKWGIETYPADHYALFISSHGSGAISYLYKSPILGPVHSIAYDDRSKDFLGLYELSLVYDNISKKIGKKIDIVVYDACVMGMIEVAYQISSYTDYLVASEANVAGKGIDFNFFAQKFNALSNKSSLNVAKIMADAYIDSPNISDSDLTMSVIDLSQSKKIFDSINLMSYYMINYATQAELTAFALAALAENVQHFGPSDYSDYSSSYIDIFDLAALINNNLNYGLLKILAQEILKIKIDNSFVVYNRIKGFKYRYANGISIFLPQKSSHWTNGNYNQIQYKFCTLFGYTNQWSTFLNKWSNVLYLLGLNY